MNIFRNLPVHSAESLKAMIEVKTHRVISMALTKSDNVQMTLFAFDKGEDVSEESYFGDTLYMCVEGVVIIKLQEKTIRLREGEVFMVKSEKLHAVSGEAAFKMLQITLNNN